MSALKRRKASIPSSIDAVVDSTCENRTSYKLKIIDPLGRSPPEVEAWSKAFAHTGTQARVRAVQMHLNCISTFSALPFSLRCRERRPMLALSAAWQGLPTDELEREWIYDTGAAKCMIGWDFLTNG